MCTHNQRCMSIVYTVVAKETLTNPLRADEDSVEEVKKLIIITLRISDKVDTSSLPRWKRWIMNYLSGPQSSVEFRDLKWGSAGQSYNWSFQRKKVIISIHITFILIPRD